MRLSWLPFALALIGCGWHGSTSPVSEGKHDGDVFIVTQGAENVKLGLVEVRVLPYEETKNSIAKTKAQAEREVANLQPKLDDARKALASAEATEKAADSEQTATTNRMIAADEPIVNADSFDRQAAGAALNRLDTFRQAADAASNRATAATKEWVAGVGAVVELVW